jgi:hypothetical protein
MCNTFQILGKYPGLVHNEPWRLGVTTNVAWYFYVLPEVNKAQNNRIIGKFFSERLLR